jgi:hypothetical protein
MRCGEAKPPGSVLCAELRIKIMKEAFKIRRGNFEVEVLTLGKLKAVEVGEDVAAIVARGLLHYDKEIGKLTNEEKGEKAAKPWSEEAQAAVELRLEAALGVMFEDVKIKATRRVKTTTGKAAVAEAIHDALRAAGLGEDAVKAAVEKQGHVYVGKAVATSTPESEAQPAEAGVEMA